MNVRNLSLTDNEHRVTGTPWADGFPSRRNVLCRVIRLEFGSDTKP